MCALIIPINACNWQFRRKTSLNDAKKWEISTQKCHLFCSNLSSLNCVKFFLWCYESKCTAFAKKMEKALVFCENFRKRRPIYDMRGIFLKSNLSDLLWTNPPTLKLDIKTLRKKYLMKFSKLYCLFLRLPNLFADIGWVIKIFSAKYIVISKRLFWTMFPPDENND